MAFRKLLPKKVTLIEVGPRDGFQAEKKIIPIDLKLEIISMLVDAGLRRIQVSSFVNPNMIPQMSDAEKIIKSLPQRNDVIFSGLALNIKGVLRAINTGLKNIDISISVSNTHSQKNTGMSLENGRQELRKMINLAKQNNMKIVAQIQCSFGCAYEGNIDSEIITEISKELFDSQIDMLTLCDTTGMGNPIKIRKIIDKVKRISHGIPIGLHLHDTRGMGLVNLFAAIEMGISYFDTSMGGMGGCPFIFNASGNISTEDTVNMLESMNIVTGININKVARCSRLMEDYLGKKFEGKLHRL